MSDGKGGRRYEVGFGRPPEASRFRPGRSGNPAGRPRRRGRGEEPPFEAVLGRIVSVIEDGVEREVSAAEAFLLYLTKRGLDGDSAAARLAMDAIAQARAAAAGGNPDAEEEIVWIRPQYGAVNAALLPLEMAVKLDRFTETARIMLEPWLVQAALARLGERRLTAEEQRVVVGATWKPEKVRWPAWWEVRRPGE